MLDSNEKKQSDELLPFNMVTSIKWIILMLQKLYYASFAFFLSLFLSFTAHAQADNNPSDAIGEGQATDLDPALIPNSPFRIIGFGDSLMAGYQLEQDQSFAAVLEKKLSSEGYEVIVDNAGVSGDTTTAGLSRLDWSVPDDAKLVILELGANDMLRGIEPEVTEQNLDAMLARLQSRKIPVLLAGMMAAPNMGAENVTKFNAIYPRLAQKYNVTLYPFFLDGVAGQSQYQLSDGMHPNKQGVEIMVDRFLPTIKAELQKLGVEPVQDSE